MPDKPGIGVIYTGGTFGMVPSAAGYVPTTDLPQRVIDEIPALKSRDMPVMEWIPHPGPPVDSSDITPAFWYELAETIHGHASAFDGFVLIHGTDTLAYTGSALSFMLAALDSPVVLTGSSIPLGEPDSDAPMNFLNALRIAASGNCSEVTIAFGTQLLRANRATKRHGSADNPFTSPCAKPLAELDDVICWTNVQPAARDRALPRFEAATQRDVRVAMLPVFPGIDAELIRTVCATGIRGLILEAYPSGIGPGGDTGFVESIHQAVESGVVVAAISQARHGSVQLGRYASGTPLAEAGLIGGADMTREAAYAKLHFLLACGLTPAEVRSLFARNLRGELTIND